MFNSEMHLQHVWGSRFWVVVFFSPQMTSLLFKHQSFMSHWFETPCFLLIFKEYLLKCFSPFDVLMGLPPKLLKLICPKYNRNQWMVPPSPSGARPAEGTLGAAGKWKEQLDFSWDRQKHLNWEGNEEGMRNQEERDSQIILAREPNFFLRVFPDPAYESTGHPGTIAPMPSNLWYVATENRMWVPYSPLVSRS